MCRHLAYLGPPATLAELLLEPPHSLARQSWAPADMRGGGTVNADGFGVGWYSAGAAAPVRYRRAVPFWADPGFADLARTVRSGAVLGAVRSATVGMPLTEGACAPFGSDGWLFSHNGLIKGWPDSMRALAGGLPVTDLLTLDASMDSALLWALVRDRLSAGQDMAKAAGEVVTEVARTAPGSRLNVLLTDGQAIVATTWTHSLSVLHGDGAVVVASEPHDDDARWTSVPDGHLLTATVDSVQLHNLEIGER
ncbi:MAG: ergothioneine biosynthesis protein EgtC [Haloechinothrix sp.]